MPYPRVGFALEGGSRANHVTNTEKKHKRDVHVTHYHTSAGQHREHTLVPRAARSLQMQCMHITAVYDRMVQ
eukprot:2004572-Prymnesium_polylepis.1